jgi:pyruvate formate-lyase activating enzyme-like uncharacterized protein
VEQIGEALDLIDELANKALRRAEVRTCLRSHINRLIQGIKEHASLDERMNEKLTDIIRDIERSATRGLDGMEQAVRELLQIVSLRAQICSSLTKDNTQINRSLLGSQKTKQRVSSV